MRKLHFIVRGFTVFGSARFKQENKYYMLAREVSQEIAKLGFAIMTGGGPGIMWKQQIEVLKMYADFQ